MEKALLISHASAGLITLITGIVAMLTPKRLKLHKPAGKVFYYTMWYVVMSAFLLSYMRSNVFLFLVGTLTFYTNVTGFRAIAHYKSKIVKINWIDWSSWIITIVLLAAVQYLLLSKYGFRFDGAFIVINVFTIILIANLIQDMKLFRGSRSKKEYLVAHIGKMGGTFIAAITAALVQNVTTDPIWVAWLMPTALVTPILIYFSRSVKNGAFWKKQTKPTVS